MSTFSWVYKSYTFGGKGVCENKHFVHTLLTFWPDFYCFHVDFLHSKNVDVYSFGWGRVSESVWFVHSWTFWHLWMAPYYFKWNKWQGKISRSTVLNLSIAVTCNSRSCVSGNVIEIVLFRLEFKLSCFNTVYWHLWMVLR